MGRMGGRDGDGAKGEVLLAGLAASGWPLVLGVNIGRRAACATVTATDCYSVLV